LRKFEPKLRRKKCGDSGRRRREGQKRRRSAEVRRRRKRRSARPKRQNAQKRRPKGKNSTKLHRNKGNARPKLWLNWKIKGKNQLTTSGGLAGKGKKGLPLTRGVGPIEALKGTPEHRRGISVHQKGKENGGEMTEKGISEHRKEIEILEAQREIEISEDRKGIGISEGQKGTEISEGHQTGISEGQKEIEISGGQKETEILGARQKERGILEARQKETEMLGGRQKETEILGGRQIKRGNGEGRLKEIEKGLGIIEINRHQDPTTATIDPRLVLMIDLIDPIGRPPAPTTDALRIARLIDARPTARLIGGQQIVRLIDAPRPLLIRKGGVVTIDGATSARGLVEIQNALLYGKIATEIQIITEIVNQIRGEEITHQKNLKKKRKSQKKKRQKRKNHQNGLSPLWMQMALQL